MYCWAMLMNPTKYFGVGAQQKVNLLQSAYTSVTYDIWLKYLQMWRETINKPIQTLLTIFLLASFT